jgi:predicted nucleotidyltransferase
MRERIKSTNALTGAQLDELTAVLTRLVDGAKAALGAEFAGAYLVGSLARGAGDQDSDVDFLVVTENRLVDEGERSVRRLHAALPEEASGWAEHLEGSYVSREELRREESDGGAWLYVDNGSRVMEWSRHDNSAVTRWMLREHGIALAGPAPETLLGAVGPDRLRAEARSAVRAVADVADDPALLANAWEQPHCVLALCRFLYTVATGSVETKTAAGEWAIRHLDARWTGLIRAAIEDRPDPWRRVHQRSDPATVGPTRAFLAGGPELVEELTRRTPKP